MFVNGSSSRPKILYKKGWEIKIPSAIIQTIVISNPIPGK